MSDRPPRSRPGDSLSFDFTAMPFPREREEKEEGEASRETPHLKPRTNAPTSTRSLDESEANEPAKNEPAKNEPAKNEPSKNEPSKNEPSKNEPRIYTVAQLGRI